MKKTKVIIIVTILLSFMVTSLLLLQGFYLHEMGINNARKSTTILNVPLIYQHKDTSMQCTACGASNSNPHAWNDASGQDGIYGTVDDCPHCSVYCAPASIAMIATYHGFSAPLTQQDDIYDNGKQSDGEIRGDGILQTHGVGMYDGIGGRPAEVQTSFQWAIGNFRQYGAGNQPLTGDVVISSIDNGTPILWLDHFGWPQNLSHNLPGWYNITNDQGHAKVIIGYDDNNTPTNYSDDRYLINDPWPEYTDKSILPLNATLGPNGAYDPYWIPASMVLNDQANDVELIDTIVIPEFVGPITIPILTLLILATVVIYKKYRSAEEA